MNFFTWGFRATKTLYNPDKPAELTTKDGSKTTVTDVVANLPTMAPNKLVLHPLLFNGILQTMFYATGNHDKFEVWYGRELFTFSDGGICSLDWVKSKESSEVFKQKYEETLPENWPRLFPRTRFFDEEELKELKSSKNEKPLVVIFHGLGGGSHEALVRNFAQLLTTGKNEGKFDVVVNLTRGCGRTKLTSEKLFNAMSVDDIHEVLAEFGKRYPNRTIYTVGFSFGAVMLTNYLGCYPEESKKLVKAAACVGLPFDLNRSCKMLEESWAGYYLFNKSISSFLNKIVKNNRTELKNYYPNIEQDLKATMASQSSRHFDETFTCKSAGYETAADYYDACSAYLRIPKITVPFFSITSKDDPTTGPYLPEEMFKENPNTVALQTDLGGHLAFVTPDKEFWSVHVVDEFFEAMESIQ